MIKFNKEKVLLLQKLIIESTGGTNGVRDLNLLDSALESVYATFDGNELYPRKEEKGARLGFNLVSNHAFVDGNKRIGLLVMISFLEMSGIKLKYTDEELIELGLGIADKSIPYKEILSWIENHKQKEYYM